MLGPKSKKKQHLLTLQDDRERLDMPVDDVTVAVTVKRSFRSRRMRIRIHPRYGVVLSLPIGIPLDTGMAFMEREKDWVLDRLDSLPAQIPFADGAEIPVLGVPRLLRHRPEARGAVWIENDEIHVAGEPQHVSRRVRDWLRLRARSEFEQRVFPLAERIGVRPKRISLRDTISRWGSCSASGSLSFSWRLVMAPEFVLDYVSAHEVAHLRVHDHSERFWDLVDTLCTEKDRARLWLKRYGGGLHRYG
jgi:predicted metal-dependent hydrolase